MIVRPRLRRKRPVVTAAFLLLLAFAGILLQPHYPLDRAVRIRATLEDGTVVEPPAHGWVSPDRLLGFHQDDQNWYPYTFDLRTGQARRLDPLLQQIQAQHVRRPSEAHSLVSPDGKWLLWGDNSFKGPSEYDVAALDGSRFMAWRNMPRREGCTIVWQEDSRAWILLYYTGKKPQDRELERAEIYTLPSSHPSQVVSLQNLHLQGNLVGQLAGHRLVFHDPWSERVVIFSLYAPSQTLRTIDLSRIASLPNQSVREVLPSPDGKRLAWIIKRIYGGPTAAVDGSDNPLHSRDFRLLVTDIDGSHVRLLGHFDAHEDCEAKEFYGGDVFGLYAWSPDSHRVLLFRDNALWWLPGDD